MIWFCFHCPTSNVVVVMTRSNRFCHYYYIVIPSVYKHTTSAPFFRFFFPKSTQSSNMGPVGVWLAGATFTLGDGGGKPS